MDLVWTTWMYSVTHLRVLMMLLVFQISNESQADVSFMLCPSLSYLLLLFQLNLDGTSRLMPAAKRCITALLLRFRETHKEYKEIYMKSDF